MRYAMTHAALSRGVSRMITLPRSLDAARATATVEPSSEIVEEADSAMATNVS
jgi:hypothetical protein